MSGQVYLVTAGEYSDYRILRAFGEKHDAEVYATTRNEMVGAYESAHVEEMPLDGSILPVVEWTASVNTEKPDDIRVSSKIVDFGKPLTGEPKISQSPMKRVNFTDFILTWLVRATHADKDVAVEAVKDRVAALLLKVELNKAAAAKSENERIRSWAREVLTQ
jgi:hypothetical protein